MLFQLSRPGDATVCKDATTCEPGTIVKKRLTIAEDRVCEDCGEDEYVLELIVCLIESTINSLLKEGTPVTQCTIR